MSRNTIRSFNGRPSAPTPLPADIPFSVPAMTQPDSRERGWALAQRMADAAKASTATFDDAEWDDENLVDPPDPALWEHLPATSTEVQP